MSKAREALEGVASVFDYHDESVTDREWEYIKTLEPLVDRDEPKQVIREHHLRAWGTCPVCKVSVGLPFHIQFCGKCGTRLVWEGEKKQAI